MQVFTRQELADWLDGLAREQTLIGPRDVEGVLLYRPIQNSADVVWEFTRPVLSIKEAFFPATERLLTIEKTGQTIELAETLPEGKQVIFGVRPCDAQGVKALDALFVQTDPVDTCYATRRENTTLVGLACKEMGPTCFCTSVGEAPNHASNVDLMLTEVKGRGANSGPFYMAHAVTEKGQALLKRLTPHEVACEPYPLVRANPVPVPESGAWPPHFDDAYWESMAERCLSCRICAYVCPTCRCFAVRDERLTAGNGHNSFERIRCWDSCAGENFRRIAGGHNPRPIKGQRLRNRFFCKLYYYPQQYGPTACTGCGRCIDACPVNIDITEVLGYLAQGEGGARP
jgi:sulfhydrogenase subunit beta (sulfur reductase)